MPYRCRSFCRAAASSSSCGLMVSVAVPSTPVEPDGGGPSAMTPRLGERLRHLVFGQLRPANDRHYGPQAGLPAVLEEVREL
jgi:hypothetical protein